MKLAFCLFKFFPFGGLERDFLRIARACKNRGHDIHVYTMRWEGGPEPDFKIHYLTVHALSNHQRCYLFAKKLKHALAGQNYDLIIGFNKLPELDLYYAADVCYQARLQERHFIHRLSPRYHRLVQLEKAVFDAKNMTEIMLISAQQQAPYQQYYQTSAARFHLLPPGIAKDRIAPENAEEIRQHLRQHYQLTNEMYLLLLIGSGFKTKRLDRAIHALAALNPELKNRCQLFVIGQDDAKSFQRLAQKLQVQHQLHFLGGRKDVADFYLAADLLLHPAYHENTGTVLLEAIVAGLPVLTVDVCGYAHYVEQARAGFVLPSPFQQTLFNTTLEKMLLSNDHLIWKKNGLAFSKTANIYSLPEKAADLIDYLSDKKRLRLAP